MPFFGWGGGVIKFSYLGFGVSFRHSFGFVAPSFVASSVISNLPIERNVYFGSCALSMSGILAFYFQVSVHLIWSPYTLRLPSTAASAGREVSSS